jgi:hypothetical protein
MKISIHVLVNRWLKGVGPKLTTRDKDRAAFSYVNAELTLLGWRVDSPKRGEMPIGGGRFVRISTYLRNVGPAYATLYYSIKTPPWFIVEWDDERQTKFLEDSIFEGTTDVNVKDAIENALTRLANSNRISTKRAK